jgi:hypothetical protein
MFGRSRRAYNDEMGGTMHGGTLVALDRGRRDRLVVQPRAKFSCASCRSDRQDHDLDEYVGFCAERSPIVADDDLGGEGEGGKS